ncbi:MAG: GtrA family protein [Oscillospiraceae bacterium]|nr:GtrA family protein [Oscillospiraceae bacterium]
MQYQKIIQKYRRVILYYLVGFVNTAADFLVYSLMLYLTRQAVLSQGIGYFSGLACSFYLNRGITFRDRQEGSAGRQLFSFLLINLISLSIGMLGISYLTKHIQISPLLAKLPVTFVTSIVNYLGYKLLVFRSRTPGKQPPKEKRRNKAEESPLPLWKTAAFQNISQFVLKRPDVSEQCKRPKSLGDAFHPTTEEHSPHCQSFEIGGARDDHRRSTDSHGI